MFHEPRIAGNTGNAIRMSAATGAALHLVAPLFDLSEAKVRRAGLDYHDLAHVVVHADLSDALDTLPDARVIAFTTQGTVRYTDVAYRDGDVLLFGPEPTGPVSYTHLRAHETRHDLVCRLLLEKKKRISIKF